MQQSMFLIISMILSAVGYGMTIHPVFAQMPGIGNINCLFFCGIPGPQGPQGLTGATGPARPQGVS